VLISIGAPDRIGSRISVARDGSDLRLIVSDDTGQESSIGVPISNWKPGEPHLITVTWGAGVERTYVDDKLVGQVDYPSTFEIRPGTPLYIGSDGRGIPGVSGTITDFTAYNRPLTPEEIASLFGDDAPPSSNTPIASGTPMEPGTFDVVLSVRSTSVSAPATAGSVCIELAGGAGFVAATQNDLTWDPGCIEILEPCRGDPLVGKEVRTNQGWYDRLRAIVFSFTDTSPIAADGVLYCCPFRLASTDAAGCCTVNIEQALGSDPSGLAIRIAGVPGQVCQR
jgi:hypothetical protein